MKTIARNISILLKSTGLFLLFVLSFANMQAEENVSIKREARRTIDKTSYIIEEAYEITDYFYYYSPYNYLSKSVYYNRHAMRLYNRRDYHEAIYYSLRAREYALMVIDDCDDYWEYFYYTFFGWSRYYGYNPYYTHPYGSGYMYGYNRGYGRGYNHGYNDGYRDGYLDNRYIEYYNYYSGNGGHYSDNAKYRRRDAAGTVSSNGIAAGSGSAAITRKEDAGRPVFHKLDASQYFDDSEKKALKRLPDEKKMDISVRSETRNMTLNDRNLSSNKDIVKTIRQSADKFDDNNRATVSRIGMVKPESIRPESAIKPTIENSRKEQKTNTVPADVISRRVDKSKVISTAPAKRMERTSSSIKTERNKEVNTIRTNKTIEKKNDSDVKQLYPQHSHSESKTYRYENKTGNNDVKREKTVTAPANTRGNKPIRRSSDLQRRTTATQSSPTVIKSSTKTIDRSRSEQKNMNKTNSTNTSEKKNTKTTRR